MAPPTDPDHIYNQIGDSRESVVIAGTLQECPQVEATRSRLLMKVESVRCETGSERPAAGLVLLTLKGPPPAWLLPGDRFMAKTALSPGSSYGTPGAFDYQRYLAHRGIWLTGWVTTPALLIKLQQLPPPSFLSRLRHEPERIRYRIGRFLENELPPATAGLYKAILIGDRSGVPPENLDQFKATGTMHLLAISGLHMGLLAAMTIGTLGWLLRRSTWLILHLPVWKATALLAILPLSGYALVAGFQAPVVRALIMILVFLLAVLADRQWNLTTNIAIAALIIMIWQPAMLLTVSFQLSFAAVVAIALILPRLWPLLSPGSGTTLTSRCKGRILAALAVSSAAALGTLPLLLFYFNRFSPISPLTTLLVEPFLCLWALTAGLLACLLLPLSAGLAGLLLKAGALGLTVSNLLTAAFAALPFSSLWSSTPSGLQMIGLYMLPVAFCFRQRFHQVARPLAGVALLLLIAPYFFLQVQQRFGEDTRVTILDIGQGSAAVIELPGGRAVLIDGGGYRSERFDPGEGIIAPFLWQRRITRLEALVISHPHADHYNGLFFIVERFRPKVIWLNGRTGNEPDYQRLLDLIAKADIPTRVPAAGEMLLGGEEYRLVNVADLHLGRGLSVPNEESLVIRLEHGDISFLFPGDIGVDSEKKLLAQALNLQADVLLAAHHGSPGSNSRDLLKASAPRYLPVSVGSSGSFHAKVQRRMDLWRRQGVIPLSTAACGSITFTTDGRHLQAATFRDCQDPPTKP